jgi:hypothetical protein
MVGAAAGAGNDQPGLDFAEPRADAFDNRPIAVQLRLYDLSRFRGLFLHHRHVSDHLHGRLVYAELGDEVVGIAAIIGLRELDGRPTLVEADALDKQARVTGGRAEQGCLFFVQEKRTETL